MRNWFIAAVAGLLLAPAALADDTDLKVSFAIAKAKMDVLSVKKKSQAPSAFASGAECTYMIASVDLSGAPNVQVVSGPGLYIHDVKGGPDDGIACDNNCVIVLNGKTLQNRNELGPWWVRNWPVSYAAFGTKQKPTRIEFTGHPEKQATSGPAEIQTAQGLRKKTLHPEGFYWYPSPADLAATPVQSQGQAVQQPVQQQPVYGTPVMVNGFQGQPAQGPFQRFYGAPFFNRVQVQGGCSGGSCPR